MARILVVEDEADLRTTLEYNLEKHGHRVRGVESGQEALDAIDAEAPDLILLDLMLPDISGTEVCRRLRQRADRRDVPVIMVTARSEEIDRVVGFEVGADDYVVKPFSVRELLLRVDAILRRARPAGTATAATASTEGAAEGGRELVFGILRVDADGHRCFVDGTAVQLTALEFRLLCTLLERRGRVQSRDKLLDDVWGMDKDVTERTVDTHVKRLREKLGAAGCYVETLRGVGYRFIERPADAVARER